MTEFDAETYTEPVESVTAVPVHIVGDSRTDPEAALLRSWSSWQLVGTEPAFRIVSNNARRKRCIIRVSPGIPGGGIVGNIFIGAREQVQNRQGGILTNGASVEKISSAEEWVMPDGVNPLTVTVLDEWYPNV